MSFLWPIFGFTNKKTEPKYRGHRKDMASIRQIEKLSFLYLIFDPFKKKTKGSEDVPRRWFQRSLSGYMAINL